MMGYWHIHMRVTYFKFNKGWRRLFLMNYADLSMYKATWGFCVHLLPCLLCLVKIRQKAMKERNEYVLTNKKI